MKKILKAIDKEIKRLSLAEVHERFDGMHKESWRLCGLIADLTVIREQVEKLG